MSRNFSEVAQHLRAMTVKADEIRVGDWLDTRGDPMFPERLRDVGFIFDVDRLSCAIIAHREGLRMITVPFSVSVTVYRLIEQCSPPFHCEFTCQCSQWHADCKRRASVTAEDRLRTRIKSLQAQCRAVEQALDTCTRERDEARNMLGLARDRLERARQALMR